MNDAYIVAEYASLVDRAQRFSYAVRVTSTSMDSTYTLTHGDRSVAVVNSNFDLRAAISNDVAARRINGECI